MRRHSAAPLTTLLVTALSVLLRASAPNTASADLGQWTPTPDPDIGLEAIHLVLLPSDGSPFHSRILWWQNHVEGEIRGWNPENSHCSDTALAGFTVLGTWNPGANIFCSGHTGLADGSLLSVGGNEDPTQFGINDARVFTRGTGTNGGTWTVRELMDEQRWYPTATTLRNGRVLVSGGWKYIHLWGFGGNRDGSAPTSGSGDLLHRFGTLRDGKWDASLAPQADPTTSNTPEPRVHAASAQFGQGLPMIVGGRDGSGDPVLSMNGWQLTRSNGSETASEYTYAWAERVASNAPPSRSHHSLVAVKEDEFIMFGGLTGESGSEVVEDKIWRLFRNNQSQWEWEEVQVTGGTAPARYGHAAVFHESTKKMVVFGGAETFGGSPTDTSLHAFTFGSDFLSGSWSSTQPENGPTARMGHTMVMRGDNNVLLYGGDDGGSGYSAELWDLHAWFGIWSPVTQSGSTPGARADHAAAWDLTTSRLFIHGGKSDSETLADKNVYVLRLGDPWKQWEASSFALDGHVLAVDPASFLTARTPEIYDPVANSWSRNATASLLRSFYPLNFVVPGGSNGDTRVISVGQSNQGYWIDVPASGAPSQAWQTMAASTPGFFPLTGVSYAPGKVLIAGGAQPNSTVPVGTTKYLNVSTGSMDSTWHELDDMEPRYYHNLVLLPTQEVLVLGGVGTTEVNETTGAIRRPQIRDPETGTWSSMTNTATRLAESSLDRNYHSTAVLLPDGRVLTSGGSGAPGQNPHETKVSVFCPPYLFDTNGDPVTVRPEINGAPASITWGQKFTVCTSDPGTVTRACLIRASATTHAFDQNQRYVPLDRDSLSGPNRLILTAPESPDHAPPGYYMLFLTGSTDGDDVPSIAQWVRLGADGGRDTCDVTPPDTLSTLSVDLISQTQAYVSWTAPADDDLAAASGKAATFDLRYSVNQIDSEGNWGIANQVTGEDTPGPVTTAHEDSIGGLQSCTWYHFALRADDDNVNLSAIHGEVKRKTVCSGGGGQLAARQVDGAAHAAAAPGGLQRGAIVTSVAPTGSGRTVVVTSKTTDGRWKITVSHAASVPDLPAGDQAPVFVQQSDGAGGWKTIARHSPGLDETTLGVGALRDGGRLVIGTGFRLERTQAGLHAQDGAYELVSAEHSSRGDLGAGFKSDGGDPGLLSGESVDLTYAPTAAELSDDSYMLITRVVTTTNNRELRDEAGTPLITKPVLHQNQPNPFTSETTIRFDLPGQASVSLVIYDLLGRRVRTIVNSATSAGSHTSRWDHRDDAGRAVGPGVYVYRLRVGSDVQERKMVLTR